MNPFRSLGPREATPRELINWDRVADKVQEYFFITSLVVGSVTLVVAPVILIAYLILRVLS